MTWKLKSTRSGTPAIGGACRWQAATPRPRLRDTTPTAAAAQRAPVRSENRRTVRALCSRPAAAIRDDLLAGPETWPRTWKERPMVRLCWVAPLLLVAVGGCQGTPPRPFPGGALVDLSHPYDAQAIFWPTAEPFRLDKVADGMTPGGYYYAANDFFTSEHGGTHVDAPIHFAQGHQTVDQMPLDRLLGPRRGHRRDRRRRPRRRLPGDGRRHPACGSARRPHSRSRHRPDPDGLFQALARCRRYLGTADRGEAAVAKLHFPGLHPDAAAWLIANRSIAAIGIDTASIDYGQSTTVRVAPGALRPRHSGVREPHGARTPAAARRERDCPADEDCRRQWRATAGGRHPAAVVVRDSARLAYRSEAATRRLSSRLGLLTV